MSAPTRTQTSRAANSRPAISGSDGGTLAVDTSGVPEDTELMWATEQVLGADFRENVRLQMQSRGFQPVLVSDMPKEAPPMYPGESRGTHDLIRRGGMVLMKRPKRLGVIERGQAAEDNAEALRSVNRDFEETISSAPGLERMKDSGVSERIERRGKTGFPE